MYWRNKRVLVTGSSGMIAQPLIDMLVEQRAEVICSDVREPQTPNLGYFVQADITYKNVCERLCKDMDVILHLAGKKGSPIMCKTKPATFFMPMLQFNTNMIETAMKEDVDWFLYTSSVGVYAQSDEFREDDMISTMPSKNDWYAGWAKRMGEMALEACKIEHGWDKWSIVRPSNVYGPETVHNANDSMVVTSLIKRALSGENPLVVWGTGMPLRDFIHRRDIARGMMFAVENQIREPINLGSGNQVTIKELVEIIVSNLDVKPDIIWDSSKPDGDRVRLTSMERAKSYGFKPIVSLEEGIKETMDWYRQNHNPIK